MYAKLALSSAFGSNVSIAQNCIRDIIRLVTSPSPNINLLSSNGAFNKGASSIIDATPAGWTFAGSNVDTGGTLPAAGSGTNLGETATQNAGGARWIVSAPCAAPNASKLKYACLLYTSDAADE